MDTVLTMTGAEQAILIGHSQGGVLIRYWDAGPRRRPESPPSGESGGTQPRHHDGGYRQSAAAHQPRGDGGELGGAVLVRRSRLRDDPRPRHHPPSTRAATSTRASPTRIATIDTVIQPPETCFLQPDDTGEDVHRNLWVENLDPDAVVLHEAMPWDSRVRALVRADLNGPRRQPTG